MAIRFIKPEPVRFVCGSEEATIGFLPLSTRDRTQVSLRDEKEYTTVQTEDGVFINFAACTDREVYDYLSRYDYVMAKNLVSIEGVEGSDGAPLCLDSLGEAERVDFVRWLHDVEGFIEWKTDYILGVKKKSTELS